MQIREATEKDKAAVFNLATKLATSYAVSKQGFDQSFSTVLELDHMLIAVAEDDDKICGYVLGNYNPCFYASGNVAWVAEILVQEPYRGQGPGRCDWAVIKTQLRPSHRTGQTRSGSA